MTIIRKRQTINSGETITMDFDFSDELGSEKITGSPAGTVRIVEGAISRLLRKEDGLPLDPVSPATTPPTYEVPAADFSIRDTDAETYADREQAYKDLTEDEWRRLGRVAHLVVRAPADARFQIWDITVSIISGSFAFSTATRVVGA